MRIAVIGGGAAGLTAAGSATGAEVVVFEHSEKVGKKIYITGKGRCNFTNACDGQTFLQNVVTNPRFLRGAIFRFPPDAAIELIGSHGCPSKTERGRRVFPLSDKASDVIKALRSYAAENGVDIRIDTNVIGIEPVGGGFDIVYPSGREHFDKVIVCTGGLSYPSTGSDGSILPVLAALGHNVIEPVPSLVGLTVKEDLSGAEGLTLKNVALSEGGIKKPVSGDLMITADGISGPIGLTLSAYAARRTFPYSVYLDLKPALSREELDARILRDFDGVKNKYFKNALDELLPKSLIPYIIERSGISPDTRVNCVTREERAALVEAIKRFRLTVTGTEGFSRAVITSGGVDVAEVDPRTMESKLVPGLYFAGEVLDVDALTGGYNFHIALATGFVAGANAGGTNG